MSAGFGIGFSRQFCPDPSLETRLGVLADLVRRLEVPRLIDFVHPEERPDWPSILNRQQYGAVEFVGGQFSGWLDGAKVEEIQEGIGSIWSEGGSFQDCSLLCDEDTDLLLPRIPSHLLNSRSKLVIEMDNLHLDSLVVMETGAALQRLQALIEDPDLALFPPTLGMLQRGVRWMKLSLAKDLPIYFAWE